MVQEHPFKQGAPLNRGLSSEWNTDVSYLELQSDNVIKSYKYEKVLQTLGDPYYLYISSTSNNPIVDTHSQIVC